MATKASEALVPTKKDQATFLQLRCLSPCATRNGCNSPSCKPCSCSVNDKTLPAILTVSAILALIGFFVLPGMKVDWKFNQPKPGEATITPKEAVLGSPEPDSVVSSEADESFAFGHLLKSLMDQLAPYQRQLRGRDAIPNEAIMQFKDKAAYDQFLADAAAAGLKIKDALNDQMAVRVGFENTDSLIKYLADHPQSGAGVSANYYVAPPKLPDPAERFSAADVPFGGSALGFIGASKNADWGAGVTIAILDSGVTAESVFGSKLRTMQLTTNATTDLSHGTAVASIAAGGQGVAQASNILSIGVIGVDGLSDTFTLAKAVRSAVDLGAKVLNISLGSYGDSTMLQQAITYAYDQGSVVVASAGNDGYSNATFPARYEKVIAVGAVDANGQIVSFSNATENYGLSAPGLEVLATVPGGEQTLFSGTSASAPFVSGAIASVMSAHPGMSAQEATALLRTYANEAGAPGEDADFGYGIVYVARVLNRNTPDLVDAAVTSHYYDSKAGTMNYVVQNQGTSTLTNWKFQTISGGTLQRWDLPAIQPTGISVLTVPLNGVDLSQGVEFSSRLIAPQGIIDINRTNNGRASSLQRK